MNTILSVNRREAGGQVEELAETAMRHRGFSTYALAMVRTTVENDVRKSMARVDVAIDCVFVDSDRNDGQIDGEMVVSIRTAYLTITAASASSDVPSTQSESTIFLPAR